MKQSLNLLLAFLFLTQLATAQQKISLGVKAGLGLCTFKFTYDGPGYGARLDWTSTFYGGIMAKTAFGKFFFQPEALYSLRGFRYAGLSDGTRYHYISMPLLFGYKPLKRLDIVVGPEFGYIVSARSQYTINGPANTTKGIDYRNTIDIDAGIAWAATSKLTVEARYVHGIKPLYNDVYENGSTTVIDKDWYSKVVQIGVCYRLR